VLTIPAGPRVLKSTRVVVGEVGDVVNTTRAADGTPLASSFITSFDRPIDPNSFTNVDVKVTFRDAADPGTAAGVDVPVLMLRQSPRLKWFFIDPLGLLPSAQPRLHAVQG